MTAAELVERVARVMTRILLAAGLVAGMARLTAMAQQCRSIGNGVIYCGEEPPNVAILPPVDCAPDECRHITIDCLQNGCAHVPNPRHTPGAIASTSRAEVCGRGAAGLTYSEAHRHTTEAMKRVVAADYGIRWADRDQYEFDHLVPLALGGADTVANIWPEPWQESQTKDDQEAEKWAEVCHQGASLDAAQQYFLSGEWEAK